MLESTPGKGTDTIAVRDVAELLLEGVQRRSGVRLVVPTPVGEAHPVVEEPAVLPTPVHAAEISTQPVTAPVLTKEVEAAVPAEQGTRKKWAPKPALQPQLAAIVEAPIAEPAAPPATASEPKRKAWTPKQAGSKAEAPVPEQISLSPELHPVAAPLAAAETPKRKAWVPKQTIANSEPSSSEQAARELPVIAAPVAGELPKRKAWTPKNTSVKPAAAVREEDTSSES